MKLEGSCHCGAVRFAVESHTPEPFMWCFCGVCRKTAGGGGYAINIMGEADTLTVTGRRALGVYRADGAKVDGGAEGDGLSPLRRHFCKRCASALWCADPRWPQWVYPFASAIDTALPWPPASVHIMLASAPPWSRPPGPKPESRHDDYPDEAIIDWHHRHGLVRD